MINTICFAMVVRIVSTNRERSIPLWNIWDTTSCYLHAMIFVSLSGAVTQTV